MTDLTPEQDATISAHIERIAAFSKGTSHSCPVCGLEVTSARLYEKIEPETFSLYVDPCGHRLGLWSKAPDWITDVRLITQDEAWNDDEVDKG